MKLTKQRLKEIIENEIRDVINEGSYPAVEEYIKLRGDPSVGHEERIAHAKKNERYLINFIKEVLEMIRAPTRPSPRAARPMSRRGARAANQRAAQSLFDKGTARVVSTADANRNTVKD